MAQVGRRRFLAGAGALAAATLAQAQPCVKPARLGLITTSLVTLRAPLWKPFFVAMEERGWREGVDYVLLERETRGDPARALALANELAGERVDLILAMATATAVTVRKATDRIPIVSWVGYPVEAGLAASLSRPGGNVTGVANYAAADVWGKFLELLREVRRDTRQIGVLWDYAPPAFPDGPVAVASLEDAARRMGVKLRTWIVRGEKDLDEAQATIEREAFDGLVLTTGGGVHNRSHVMDRLGGLVVRKRLPVITDIAGTAVFARTNCMLAYSPNVPEILTRLADLTDRILRGASPAELPFERPTKFELAISRKAARAIGLQVPQALLLRADRVID